MTRLQVRESNNAASVSGRPRKRGQLKSGRIACGGMRPAAATGIGVNFGLDRAASPSPEPNIECAERNAAAPYWPRCDLSVSASGGMFLNKNWSD